MLEFKLNIHCNNEAFDEEPSREIARILREVATRLENEGGEEFTKAQTLRDINGNDVGRAKLIVEAVL